MASMNWRLLRAPDQGRWQLRTSRLDHRKPNMNMQVNGDTRTNRLPFRTPRTPNVKRRSLQNTEKQFSELFSSWVKSQKVKNSKPIEHNAKKMLHILSNIVDAGLLEYLNLIAAGERQDLDIFKPLHNILFTKNVNSSATDFFTWYMMFRMKDCKNGKNIFFAD